MSTEVHAVLYAAKSTEDKKGSIPTQLADVRAMSEREGWSIIGEERDEGFSAYSGNRGPGLERAKQLAADTAAEHGRCMLVAQHSDRFARGGGDAPDAADHLAEMFFWARRHDVELRSVQDDANLTNPLLAFVMGERNFEDSRRKSEATRAGMRRRAERGLFNGGPAPYGYVHTPEGLVLIPHEAKIVERIYREYVAGRSQRQIARDLTRDGIPTKRGAPWSQPIVRKILASPLYDGRILHRGETLAGTHERIVTAELWREAEQRRNALARTRGGGRGRVPIGQHLFIGGTLRCGGCGSAMVPRSNRGRPRNDGTAGTPYEVYQCLGKQRDAESCSQGAVSREAIDRAVHTYFETVGLDMEATRAEIAAAGSREVDEVRALRQAADRELAKAHARFERVKRDYQDGKLEAYDWREQRDELRSELQAATADLERLSAHERELAEATPADDLEESLLAWLTCVRAAVIGAVRDAGEIAAVRAALLRVFEAFLLRPIPADSTDWTQSPLVLVSGNADYALYPVPRPEALTYEAGTAVLSRVPLQPASVKVPTSRGNKETVGRPFVYDELLARIRALLRRAVQSDVIEAGDVVVDRGTRRVTVLGRPVVLSAKEFELLVQLASQPYRVFTKEELLRDVWGFRSPSSRTRTLDSHASRLRRKLSEAGVGPYVLNVWGVGYRLLDGRASG